MKPDVQWELMCRRNYLTPTSNDLRRVREVAERLGELQVCWGIVQYSQQTPLPSVKDFEDWLVGAVLPDEVVCAAYLTEDPEITDMADRLEELEAAWFPTEEVETEARALRERLKVLLR